MNEGRLPAAAALAGMVCDHPRLDECCEGCGHYTCPDCGLYWDEGAWGGGPFDDQLCEGWQES